MAHADALTSTLQKLGAPVPPEPKLTFPPGGLADRGTFLGLAATLEPVGVGAYGGAAGALQSKDLLAVALSIHNVECQHRTAINILRGILPPNDLTLEPTLQFQAVVNAGPSCGVTPG